MEKTQTGKDPNDLALVFLSTYDMPLEYRERQMAWNGLTRGTITKNIMKRADQPEINA